MTTTGTVISERVTADGRRWMLRPAQSSDAEALARLFAAVRSEGRWLVTPPTAVSHASEAFFIGELINAHSAAVLVADATGAVVGNALVLIDRDVASSHVGTLSLVVDAGWRDVGIGSALVAAAQAWARERGLVKVALSVFPDNPRAIAVYQKAGFVREGVRRRQFRVGGTGAYRDEVLMAWFPEGAATDTWRAMGDAP